MSKKFIPSGPAPASVVAGKTDDWHHLVVLDATTGEQIHGVREANAETGEIVRNELKDGNLVVEDNAIAFVTEQRAIRIEWAIDQAEPAGSIGPIDPPSDGNEHDDEEAN